VNFQDWTPPEPAQIIDLRPDGAVLQLSRYYGGSQPAVVFEVFGQAYSLGAQMAVIEFRYLDPDYRSEHSRFYSTTFRRYPSVAHRVHFFKEPPLDEMLDDEDAPFDFADLTYLGFTVLRPLPGARVGRTMLSPHEDLAKHVMCQAFDTVNVFGHPMRVRAAPFMAQDAQLGVCAHMTLWTSAYFHHIAYGHNRYLSADISAAVPANLGIGRPAPSTGLTVGQIAAGSTQLGRPALVYECDNLPKGESIQRIACRYLNSGMPVIVAAGGMHAFVLVGYRRDFAGSPDERIRFIAQDDERGPYQLILDFEHDRYGKWDHLIVPLPHKVFVPGEVAEELGAVRLRRALTESQHAASESLLADLDRASDDDESITFRSTVIRSNRFKETLSERGATADVAALYGRLQLPRWIWVIEATKRGARNRGERSVAAEVVIDATDHSRDMKFLAMRLPGELWSWRPDEDQAASRPLGPQNAYGSVSRYVLAPELPAEPN
jgi:hypothetical protein